MIPGVEMSSGAQEGKSSAGMQSPQTLDVLAAAGSLNMSDVALLSEVATSTLSRLWFDDSWLDRISGSVLQNLVAVIPGLHDYVSRRSRTRMIEAALRHCDRAGLDVSRTALDSLLRKHSSNFYVATVLAAAASVVERQHRWAFARLTRCWGAQPDVILDALFASGPDALLSDTDSFISHATRIVETDVARDNSLHSTVGSGILIHKLAKRSGTAPIPDTRSSLQRGTAFSYRSTVVGVILNSNDVDASLRYQAALDSVSLLQRNELWSLASYSSDLSQTPDFSIPSTVTLQNTAELILSDIANLNEAYLHYLTTSAIPTVLKQDQKFGGFEDQLAYALKCRIDKGIADRRVMAACDTLLTKIA